MNLTICTFNEDLSEYKKMLAYNQKLVNLGTQLSKLELINQQPISIDVDKFYEMSQAVMPKASSEMIYIGVGLIVGGFLNILGINDKNIIYRVPNGIPSPSSHWSVVKKYLEAKFMRIVGFAYKYLCSM